MGQDMVAGLAGLVVVDIVVEAGRGPGSGATVVVVVVLGGNHLAFLHSACFHSAYTHPDVDVEEDAAAYGSGSAS